MDKPTINQIANAPVFASIASRPLRPVDIKARVEAGRQQARNASSENNVSESSAEHIEYQDVVMYSNSDLRPRKANLFALAGTTNIDGSVHYFQSWLEFQWLCLLLSLPTVERVQTQPSKISVVIDGEKCWRTFDLLVRETSGIVRLCAVRPEKFAKVIRHELSQISHQCSGRAHKVNLLTEKKLCPIAANNARLLHEARYPDPEADERVRRVVGAMEGSVDVMALAGRVGGGGAFHGVLRAVEQGHLIQMNPLMRMDRPRCYLVKGN